MADISERLLDAWLRISTTIVNARVVSELSYNETLVCHELCRTAELSPDRRLTATDLCTGTRMLKSQMNRTLNALERRGMIVRERSTDDRRQVFITLRPEGLSPYEAQHEYILSILGHIIDEMGEEKIGEVTEIFNRLADIADETLPGQKGSTK